MNFANNSKNDMRIRKDIYSLSDSRQIHRHSGTD